MGGIVINRRECEAGEREGRARRGHVGGERVREEEGRRKVEAL